MILPKPKAGDLQVWWKPQVPCKSFIVPVKTVDEAKMLLRALADYDAFQYENKIKPDYCNAGGLSVWADEEPDDDGWLDWEDEDGNDIDEVMRWEDDDALV